MSTRTEVTLTASYQEISTKKCVITITEKSSAKLFLNNANSDAAAISFYPEVGEQIVENEDQSVFAKGKDIIIIVDKAV